MDPPLLPTFLFSFLSLFSFFGDDDLCRLHKNKMTIYREFCGGLFTSFTIFAHETLEEKKTIERERDSHAIEF